MVLNDVRRGVTTQSNLKSTFGTQTGQDRMGQNRTGQNRTGAQCLVRHCRTGQDRTKPVKMTNLPLCQNQLPKSVNPKPKLIIKSIHKSGTKIMKHNRFSN